MCGSHATEGISITRFPYDDYAWHVQLRASNGSIATTIDFYTQPDDLKPFASALGAFPRGPGDEACFEVGSDLGRWAYHIYLRAYGFDSVGHSALEILTDNRTEPPDHARVHFAIRCEAASLNRLGNQLSQWIQNSDEPLHWNSRNA
ncbi:MAG: hypothetical protein P4L99_12440 [Chthoniobacter sp.]|nr:hypothetical protein [Chthoniobacter sp.]